ncbi:Rho GTPase activation protein [Dichotomocladium elegans]|nr:Rho GTPase activation protein [Dichotomocladium elegans]
MSSSDVAIPGVFTSSQKETLRTWWKKVTTTYPKASNFKTMEMPIVGKAVFGIPLAESIKYARVSISYIDDRTGKKCYGAIPVIVAKCGSFLKEEALAVKGIFRLCGNAKRIGVLQAIFDSPDHGYGIKLDWRGYTTYDAASVLRRFLNCLPEPVITHDHYHLFKEMINKSFPDHDAKVNAFQGLIESLPLANQYLLLYLLDLLGVFASHTKSTLMDIPSLAVLFTPGILCHPHDNMDPASYKESQRVIQFLVENQTRFAIPQSLEDTQATSQTAGIEEESIEGRAEESIRDISYVPVFRADKLGVPATRLRRSKTAPSRRCKYGEHESPQVVHVNRYASQGANAHSKWVGRHKSKEQAEDC